MPTAEWVDKLTELVEHLQGEYPSANAFSIVDKALEILQITEK